MKQFYKINLFLLMLKEKIKGNKNVKSLVLLTC